MIPSSQLKTVWLNGIKQFAQSHLVIKWLIQNLNSSSDSEAFSMMPGYLTIMEVKIIASQCQSKKLI